MDFERRLSKLGEEVRSARANHGAGHFHWPSKIRVKVLELVAAGVSASHIKRATGITMSTYQYWQRQKHGAGFRELKVGHGQPSTPRAEALARLTIRTERGTEISGLDMSQLERLLERRLIS